MKLIEWLRQIFIENLAEEKPTPLNELTKLTGDLAIKHEKPTQEKHIEFFTSNEPKLIGLSFSRCMSDLLSGEVEVSEVRKLITGTQCQTESDFLDVINKYKQLKYWQNYSVEEVIGMYAKIKHLIYQPRLEGKGYPCCVQKWVNNENEIIWLGRK
ncbi:hypothetical protein [Coleofasciculus sp. E1-EBD-02]|uniref:hypothetical protein n=1 Tax=Coleofasciculus sp. E1-EBD-02 TaxID=3068481 RepID=UPI0032F5DC03